MRGATEHLVPADGRKLSPQEFADTAGLSEGELHELEEYQLLRPDQLDLSWALAVREATRLRADFDLDLFATGLLAGYIRRVHELQDQLQQQRAHTPARTTYTEVSYTEVRVGR
ncbi:hypothetical protein [Ramlibacter algicola]|uniref:Uncharacterized protein n=1 Tax=Ramlibacter algicola TaxID=2795217 RepID=A0A934Q0E8_9BURK|nr:hypothetical protein [Ramlibacter algicola]MBK0392009.1 hypothetical protein [Ramlibacter algicola]